MSTTIKKILIIVVGIIAVLIALFIIFLSTNAFSGKTLSMAMPRSMPMESSSSFDEERKLTKGKFDTVSDTKIKQEKSSRLMIKTGTIYVTVENINNFAEEVIKYVEGRGGWIVNSNIVEEEIIRNGNITVRIPAKTFNETMLYFKKLVKKVTFEEIQAKDITEEYTDIQSRLRNLESAEKQLLKIMDISGSIPDILAVQRELVQVRDQIEQAKGRAEYLKGNVEMATIHIDLALSEELLPIPATKKWQPVYVIKQAWKSLSDFFRHASYFLIWVGVYAIIWIPLVVIIWWATRKHYEKNKK